MHIHYTTFSTFDYAGNFPYKNVKIPRNSKVANPYQRYASLTNMQLSDFVIYNQVSGLVFNQ